MQKQTKSINISHEWLPKRAFNQISKKTWTGDINQENTFTLYEEGALGNAHIINTAWDLEDENKIPSTIKVHILKIQDTGECVTLFEVTREGLWLGKTKAVRRFKKFLKPHVEAYCL